MNCRARINNMKIAPVRGDMVANNAATSEVRTPLPAATIAPKPVPPARQARRCGLMLQITAPRLRRSHSVRRHFSSIVARAAARCSGVSRRGRIVYI
jgi:hypothetical protein